MSTGLKILESQSLRELTWWKIGGLAEHFCQPTNVAQLREAVETARQEKWPIEILGGGTNVLVSDQGVSGLVICMRSLTGLEVLPASDQDKEMLKLEAWAGTPKSELTKVFLRHKLWPALFLCGLPGDVGGGVVMNAGVGENIAPREFCEIVEWVEVMDLSDDTLSVRRMQKDELHWSYRHSTGWQPGIVTRVGLQCPMRPSDEVPSKVREATKNRLLRQPLEWPSCGSTFKNPPGHKAGALIEQAGLKGRRIGDAQISEKHANFIINLGKATSSQVMELIETVQAKVKAQFNVSLETEVRRIGRF